MSFSYLRKGNNNLNRGKKIMSAGFRLEREDANNFFRGGGDLRKRKKQLLRIQGERPGSYRAETESVNRTSGIKGRMADFASSHKEKWYSNPPRQRKGRGKTFLRGISLKSRDIS